MANRDNQLTGDTLRSAIFDEDEEQESPRQEQQGLTQDVLRDALSDGPEEPERGEGQGLSQNLLMEALSGPTEEDVRAEITRQQEEQQKAAEDSRDLSAQINNARSQIDDRVQASYVSRAADRFKENHGKNIYDYYAERESAYEAGPGGYRMAGKSPEEKAQEELERRAQRLRQEDINEGLYQEREREIAEQLNIDGEILEMATGERMAPMDVPVRREYRENTPIGKAREAFTNLHTSFRQYLTETAKEKSDLQGIASWVADTFTGEVEDEETAQDDSSLREKLTEAAKTTANNAWEFLAGEERQELDITRSELTERAEQEFPEYLSIVQEIEDYYDAGETETVEYMALQARKRMMEDYIVSGEAEDLGEGIAGAAVNIGKGALSFATAIPRQLFTEEGSDTINAFVNDPGGMTQNFAEMLIFNPQYGAIPGGWVKGGSRSFAKLSEAGYDVSTIGSRARIFGGSAKGSAVRGAAIEASSSAMRQLGEDDGINWGQVGEDTGLVGALAPVFEGPMHYIGRAFGSGGVSRRAKLDFNKAWIEDRAQRIIDSESVIDDGAGFRFRTEVDPQLTRRAYDQASREAETVGILPNTDKSAPPGAIAARMVGEKVRQGRTFIDALEDTRRVAGERNLPDFEVERLKNFVKGLKIERLDPVKGSTVPRIKLNTLEPQKNVLRQLEDGTDSIPRKKKQKIVRDTLEEMTDDNTRKEIRKSLPKSDREAIRRNMNTTMSLSALSAGIILAQEGDQWQSAIQGALSVGAFITAGFLGARALRGRNSTIGDMLNEADRTPTSMRAYADEFKSQFSSMQLAANRGYHHITSVLPNKARREELSDWLEGYDIEVSPDERAVLEAVRSQFDWWSKRLEKDGVLNNFTENYLPHVMEQMGPEATKRAIGKLRSSLNESFRHAKDRKFKAPLRVIEKAGYKVRTRDFAELLQIYETAAAKSLSTKRLVEGLKKSPMSDGNEAIVSRGKFYKNKKKYMESGAYSPVTHPSFDNYFVHESAKPLFDFFFDSHFTNSFMRSASTLNFLSKRSLVALSTFHAQTLIESMIFAGTPFKDIGSVLGGIPKGKSPILEMFKYGQMGDMVDLAVRTGTTFGVDDVGKWDTFYRNLDSMSRMADEWADSHLLAKGVRKVTKPFTSRVVSFNKKMDQWMWDRLHTGAKLTVFSREMERLRPKYPNLSDYELGEMVSSFVNDAFGGLDWYRIATRTQEQGMRTALLKAFSPKGREVMQNVLFAPDWTLSNIRILGKGATGVLKTVGNAIKGKKRSMTVDEMLSLRYGMRGAAYYAVFANAINIGFTGHPTWENERMDRIELGDGRNVVWSKQFFEPMNWLTDPSKTGWNKMSVLMKTLPEQVFTKQWMQAPSGAGPAMYEEDATTVDKLNARVGHLASKFNPIGIQQWVKDGPREALTAKSFNDFLMSIGGHPRYGRQTKRTTFDAGAVTDYIGLTNTQGRWEKELAPEPKKKSRYELD